MSVAPISASQSSLCHLLQSVRLRALFVTCCSQCVSELFLSFAAISASQSSFVSWSGRSRAPFPFGSRLFFRRPQRVRPQLARNVPCKEHDLGQLWFVSSIRYIGADSCNGVMAGCTSAHGNEVLNDFQSFFYCYLSECKLV